MPAGIGLAMAAPVLSKKTLPRALVATERCPVDPTTNGTAAAN